MAAPRQDIIEEQNYFEFSLLIIRTYELVSGMKKDTWKRAFLLLGTACLIACSPFTVLNAVSPNSTAKNYTGLSYGSHPRQRLDVYLPEGPRKAEPVVIFFYGGNWNSGERKDYAFVGKALASRGIVAVVADYRLSPEVQYPQILQDAAQAVAWTLCEAGRFGGDPARVFVMGHSAGAYNAAMLALDRRWLAEVGLTPAALKGWIGLAGPYNFLPIENVEVRPVFFYPDTPAASQPINHVTPTAPPALLIAPENDAVVNSARNTARLAKELRSKDVPVVEKYFESVSHPTLVATLSRILSVLAPTLETIERFVEADHPRPSAGPAAISACRK